jgi:hypothetical protein
MGISIGSIANIAKKHRVENERACSKHEQRQPKSSDVNISDVIKSIIIPISTNMDHDETN